jgi:hypothetical protein
MPEPQTALKLRLDVLDVRETLVKQLDDLLLRLRHRRPLRLRRSPFFFLLRELLHRRQSSFRDVAQRLRVRLEENTHAGVGVALEGEGEGDAEVVVVGTLRITAEEEVDGDGFDEGAEGAGGGADEGVEDDEFARERSFPLSGLQRHRVDVSTVAKQEGEEEDGR